MNPQQILRCIHNERLAKATSRSEAPVMHGTGLHSPTTAAIARPRACCASAATTHMPATNMSLGRESAVQQQQQPPPEAAAHIPAAQSRINASLGRAPDVHRQLPAAAAHMPPHVVSSLVNANPDFALQIGVQILVSSISPIWSRAALARPISACLPGCRTPSQNNCRVHYRV